MIQPPLTTIDLPGLSLFKTGKVRSVFDLGDTLLMVTSDRVSAFDVILPDGIPGKGEILTQTTAFWCDFLSDVVPHHLLSIDVDQFPAQLAPYQDVLRGRSMWVKKTALIPIECVARGYLAGSGWKDYQQTGAVCGVSLPPGLRLAEQLPEPIFTPAFKAELGAHDENISFAQAAEFVGADTATRLKEITLALFAKAQAHANACGLILADTKFEFGWHDGQIILIDEVLTPDSSRYWAAEDYQVGISPPSFDKQIIRDYLEICDWNKQAPGPRLPEAVIAKTAARYQAAYTALTTTKGTH